VRKAILSGLGVGLVPGLPGTYASAVTAAAAAGLAWEGTVPWTVAACLAWGIGTVATLALAGRPAAASDDGDPPWIVTDEIAGQGLALAVAYALGGDGFAPCVLAFVLFRVLDVTKPGPIRRLERLPGAAGVLFDDLAAGALAGGAVLAARLLGAFTPAPLAW
jgi:phosphatidylglycerophosphatase A